jgi:hypothetical protein
MTRPMKAFVCEVDQHGLRQLLPEEDLPGVASGDPAWAQADRSRTVARAVLADRDAEAIRVELAAGRPGEACALLLNRAVELLAFASALPTSNRRGP